MKKPSVVFSLLAMAMVFHFQGAVQAQTETAKKRMRRRSNLGNLPKHHLICLSRKKIKMRRKTQSHQLKQKRILLQII